MENDPRVSGPELAAHPLRKEFAEFLINNPALNKARQSNTEVKVDGGRIVFKANGQVAVQFPNSEGHSLVVLNRPETTIEDDVEKLEGITMYWVIAATNAIVRRMNSTALTLETDGFHLRAQKAGRVN